MKPFIKFIVQSLVVGIIALGIGYLLTINAIKLVNNYVIGTEVYKFALFLSIALFIGAIISLLHVNPINLIARLFLKGIAVFYQEFFKQGAKYFTIENTNQPFQTIVEVTLDENIKVLGFLTNRMPNNKSGIFIPTSRRLTSGFNIIVRNEKVSQTNISPEEFLKYIVTSGAHQIQFNF